ncbi:uncharacterized protein LOC106633669 [Haplochromis burtoni]|uniref:uncharacterized protein LOC106633669 n=1 Tax=Haplochromis burtoni TaxID=8153 RepID=UPI0006C9A7B5|nr:uncharacterized protein LOC106633669 [Haplochromis burtoni]
MSLSLKPTYISVSACALGPSFIPHTAFPANSDMNSGDSRVLAVKDHCFHYIPLVKSLEQLLSQPRMLAVIDEVQDRYKMAPSMAASSRAPPSNGFLLCLILLFLYFFTSSICLLVYDRQTLLDIKDGLSYNFPEFKFCNTDAPFADPPFISPETPLFSVPGGRKRRRRGRRSGVLVRLRRRTYRPPLPSLLLANVQSLENKLCELRARISFQREMRDCCVICLTETWLSDKVPDSAIQLPGFSVHRADRSQDLTGKSRGGGVCFMINNSWCDYANVHPVKSFCSPDLEYLMIKCRPFWLPREFTAVIIAAVYIPPKADTKTTSTHSL